MHDLEPYAEMVLLVSLTILLGVGSSRLAEWFRVPAPALFLVTAAVASDIVPRLDAFDVITDQRIVTAALVVILFDGGMHIGWHRMRPAVGGVLWLGVAGTLITTAAIAGLAHALLGYEWRTAPLLGTALAPTDPAVVFSVLGRREITGRSGTLLEGESGANDPVGIALMVSLLTAATSSGGGAVLTVVEEFTLQLVVGAVVGVVGGRLMIRALRPSLPNEGLYVIRSIAFVGLIYSVAVVARGSGFLAVFLAGIIVADARAPYKRDVERFHTAAASLGEIVAFTVLGLTVNLRSVLDTGVWSVGLALALILAFIVRPVLVGLVLWPV